MRSSSILSVAGLAALVAAQPMINQRDFVTTKTVYEEVVKTIDVTSTTYIYPPGASPTEPVHKPNNHKHHHNHKSSSVVAAPTEPAAPPPPVQPQPQPVAPTPEPQPVAPKPKQPVVPKPKPSPEPVAPAPAPAPPAPKPAPSNPEPAAGAHSGDMTHYAPGLGSCGITSSASEDIVALAFDFMDNPANPNDNPLCGKTITIDYEGAQHTAKIVDSCGGCATFDIDLSPTLFKKVAPSGDGRVPDVKWWVNA